MKQLTCEMCGSTEIIKQDGFFVCQTCGTKYSAEEAKKMMVEGTVNVQGTVKVDNTAFVEKYIANARRAMQKEDWEETEKYYNMVEQNDPSNIEAIFYSSYAKARTWLIDSDYFKREHAFTVLCNTVSIIDDNYTTENIDMIEQISEHIKQITSSGFIYKGNEKDKIEKTYTLFSKLNIAWVDSLFAIAAKTNDVNDKRRVYNKLVEHYIKSKDNGFVPPSNITNYYEIAHKYLMNSDYTYKGQQLKKEKESKEAAINNRMLELQKRFDEKKSGKNKWLIFFIVISTLYSVYLIGIPFLIWAIWLKRKNDNLKIEEVYPEYKDLKNKLNSLKKEI